MMKNEQKFVDFRKIIDSFELWKCGNDSDS